MVSHSGTSSRAHHVRPLNTPREITVITENMLPIAIVTHQHEVRVIQISETWRIDDEWWRERIHRHYYRLTLENGSIRTIYHDVVANTWHDQQY